MIASSFYDAAAADFVITVIQKKLQPLLNIFLAICYASGVFDGFG